MSSSSNNPNNNEIDPELRGKIKDASRENRLSFKNRAEQLLRYEMKEEALEICKPYLDNFAKCSAESGLLVVFKCQSQLKEMNTCMAKHNGEEAWQKYKQDHSKELEIRSRGQKYV